MRPTPAPVRLSRAEQRQRNRAALLDAAARVFAARGFRVATIDEVAEAAGLTKGAVYSHFASKHDLFASAIARRYEERVAAFREAMDRDDLAPEERARHAAQEFAQSVTANPDWALLFLEAWAEMLRNPGFGAELRALTDALRTAVAQLVDEQIGARRAATDLDSEAVAQMILTIANGFGIEHRLDPRHAPAELFGKTMAVFATGLVAEPHDSPPAGLLAG